MSTDLSTCREPAGSGPLRLQAITLHALHTGRLTILRAAALFDGVSSTLMAEPTVMVADGTIAAVHGPAGPLRADAHVVDLPGLTLMPGLVDAHLHLCFDASSDPVGHLAETDDDVVRERMAEAARRALSAGVTTVRDLGDRGYLALDLRDRGPRAEPGRCRRSSPRALRSPAPAGTAISSAEPRAGNAPCSRRCGNGPSGAWT